MKTKIVKKKKISRISSISRLKNKKRSQLKWKGMGGSLESPENSNEWTIIGQRNQTKKVNLNPITLKSSIKKESQSSQITSLKNIASNITLIEITDSFFQIEYIHKNTKNETEKYYFIISLDKLSIDRLQYYINNSILQRSITDSTDLGNFLTLNINTLVLKVLNTGGQKRTGSSDDFIDVYEDDSISIILYEENIETMVVHNRFRINVGLLNDDKYEDKVHVIPQINKDISWLNRIYIDLNANTNIEGKDTMKNIDYFLELYKAHNENPELNLINKDTKIFTCDDLNVDHTRLIIDKIIIGKIEDNTIEEYVIIGYPDKNMIPYLDLYNKNKAMFDGIYEKHKSDFMKYMAELHNSMPEKKNKIDPNNLETEIHKFYDYESYYKYTSNFYENAFTQEDKDNYNNPNYPANKEYGIKYDPNFQIKFRELQKAFYNELASKCLHKPIMKINYVFFIFKKHTEGKYINNYVPAIFNFRQFTYKHHPILQRLEYLIKTRLSKIYGIIEDETKEEYKLWYSHYNYGDIFHIKTEYVHTMSNIQQQAYKYKNSITLEELIYMLSIPDVDLINLRLDYQKKQDEFNQGIKESKKTYKLLENQEKKFTINKCYKPNTELLKKEVLIKLEAFLDKNTKILLMFMETGNIYTIIYKNGTDNKFYKIKLQSNLCSIYIKIIKNLYNNIENVNIFKDLIMNYYKEFNRSNNSQKTKPNLDLSTVYNIVGLELYKVIEHRIITYKDYIAIMRYNPLLVREIKKRTNEPTITISEFFDSPLVKISNLPNTTMVIPNPYLKKPILTQNILATEIYVREFNKFMINYKKNNFKSYEYNNNTLEPNKGNLEYLFNFSKGIKDINIHKIYFNPNNCKYNLIEIKEKTKKVIWIVPLNSSHNDNINNNINDDLNEFNDTNLSKEYKLKYLKNFIDLTINHIPLLNEINKLYYTNKVSCFINSGSFAPIGSNFHIHVFENEMYRSSFETYEQGSKIQKLLNTKTAKNLLMLEPNYYNKYKCETLIHDKI